MNYLKKLAGQTAVYGLSSMAGRFINYLLVFVHTRVFIPEEYGVVTAMYSYTTFLMIVFTYGMETAFFRFATKSSFTKEQVFGTSLFSLIVSSLGLLALIIPFQHSIAGFIEYPSHPEYVWWFALILAFDAISSIPFVNLRLENRPLRFASLRLVNILITVLLNLFFLVLCPWLAGKGVQFADAIYDPAFGVGYVFLSNLIASVITFLLVLPDMFRMKISFRKDLWKEMMFYALPLLPAGLAGMINETLDRILLVKLIPNREEALFQTGIYGANYKLAMLMTLFIQTFRYAAEPFFFSEAGKEDSRQRYATIMKYFVIVCCFIFLVVLLYLDIIKLFIGKDYHSGLNVVPVLLLANLFLGIYVNLSIWFKLTDKTRFGLYFTIFGAVITIVLNYLWIPVYGYTGSAWATLVCYFCMTAACYFAGRKHYPVNYPVSRILIYIGGSLLVYYLSLLVRDTIEGEGLVILVNSAFLLIYLGIVLALERLKKIVP